jgi:hypothetical protein
VPAVSGRSSAFCEAVCRKQTGPRSIRRQCTSPNARLQCGSGLLPILTDLLGSELLCDVQCVGRRHFYVGLDARAFPIALRDWMDEAPEGASSHSLSAWPAGVSGIDGAVPGAERQDRH